MKTSELTGPLLDYWVAKAQGFPVLHGEAPGSYYIGLKPLPNYSSDWSHGGPIIESERIDLHDWGHGNWGAGFGGMDDEGLWLKRCCYISTSPLIAAMRAYVASKFGEELDISTA